MAEGKTSSEKFPDLKWRVNETLYTLLHPRAEIEADVVFGLVGTFLAGVATWGNPEGMAAGAAISTLMKPAGAAVQKLIDRDEDIIVPDHILKVLYNAAQSFATGQSPYDKK